MKTQIERVSEWIVQTNLSDIPEDVIELGKLQFLDCITSSFSGSRSDIGEKISSSLSTSLAEGIPSIPRDELLNITDWIYYHSAMINALEMDNFTLMGHVSQSAFSVSFSLGFELKKSFGEILRALILGNEIGGRIGAYMVTGPQQGHMRAFVHRCAGATSAACLLGLDENQTARSLAIALSMPEFPLYPAAFSPDTKVICTSSPSVEGYRAALLAKEGLEPALDIIENPEGFWNYFTYMNYLPDIWGQVGKTWSMYALSIKTQASCAYAQSAIYAARKAMYGKKLNSDDVKEVKVRTSMITILMEAFSMPHYNAFLTPVNTQFSTKRSVAAALLYGSIDGTFYKKGNFDKCISQIEELSKKIELVHDWKKTIDLLKGFDRGLMNGGMPGVLGMGQTSHTLKIMKRSFGSRKLVTLSDIPLLLMLPKSDLKYFLRRYYRGVRPTFPFLSTDKQKKYVSYECDLEQIEFRLASSVLIIFNDGTTSEAEQIIPPGFSGDPNRFQIGIEKFEFETNYCITSANQESIIDLVFQKDLEWNLSELIPHFRS